MESDVYRLVGGLERSDKSVYTKRDYKVAMKVFFTWLNKGTETDIVSWISTGIPRSQRKIPEELLDIKEDILKQIDVCDHPRDKAIIATWYDSGGRVGEGGTRQIKHIVFDQYGAVMIVGGKTGMRRIRLVFAAPYLAAWLDVHPLRNNPEAPLWVAIGKKGHNELLMYNGLRDVVKKTAKQAGIEKRVYNHLYRHTRATDLAHHLTSSQLNSHLGWVQGSNQAQTYIHLSGEDVEPAIFEMYGITKPESNRTEFLVPWDCPRCKKANAPTSEFCSQCGSPKDTATALEAEDDDFKRVKKYAELLRKFPDVFEELENIE